MGNMYISPEISRLSKDERNLYVDLRPRLDVYLRYISWNEGLIVYRFLENAWQVENFDPDISLIVPGHLKNKSLPVYQFIQQIPENIRKLVSPFQYLQTILLQLCAQSWETQRLLHDLPLLLWLIVHHLQSKGYSSNDAKHLIRKKRKDILKEIFGKGSNADIKMLRKISINDQSFDESMLQAIKKAIENDYSIRLRHESDINFQHLFFLRRCPFLAESRLLSILASKQYKGQAEMMDEIREIGRLWRDVAGLGDLLDMDSRTSLNKCDSMESIQGLHDRWPRFFNRTKRNKNDAKVLFPKALIYENPSIVQIMNLDALKDEGRYMHHCVGSYAQRILEGSSLSSKFCTLNGRPLSI